MDEVQKDLSALSLEGKSYLVVANKIDLTELASDYIREGIMGISAKEKIKIDSLKQKIFELVLSDIPEQDQTVISNLRHYEALSLAEQALTQVENGLHNARSGDFLAMDIRQALAYLGQITGEVGVEDLLEHIFSKFCIGK
jgi:tRNA modification GTPase